MEILPRGVLWRTVGQDTGVDEVLDRLEQQPGARTIAVLAADEPLLVILDDVWNEDLVLGVRDRLPETVTTLVTTRGLRLPGFAALSVETMSEAQAVGLLAGAVPRTSELEVALASLASALGHWPLLLDMAAHHLHFTDLSRSGVDAAAGGATELSAADLILRARKLQDDFAEDPTALDDPGGLDDPSVRQRSLTRMIERSLRYLHETDQQGFRALAVYRPGVLLTQAMLGDLWELTGSATERRMRRLTGVGLATVGARGELLRLHDLVVAWLHQTQGDPDHPDNSPYHARAAKAALGPAGSPGILTGERAEWLAYHLCRSGDHSAPARLLRVEWRGAYQAGTGSDSSYQKALRDVIAYYAAVADGALAGAGLGLDQADAWLLEGVLRHAQITAEVDAIPVDALVAIALSGEPQGALRRAVGYPRRRMAQKAMVGILEALAKQGELRDDVSDLAADLAQDVFPDDALYVLTGMAEALEPLDYQRALDLRRRAVEFANARSDTVAQLAMSTFEAVTLAQSDPARAAEVVQEVQRRAAAMPKQQLGVESLVVVADALRSHHHEAALRLIRQAQAAAEAIVEQPARSAALSYLARSIAHHDPDEAERLAGAIADQDRHDRTLAALTLALAPSDPQRARRLAEAIPNQQARRKALMEAAKTLAPGQESVAREFLQRAEQLATALTDPDDRQWALAEVARALAPIDAEQAKRMADGDDREWSRSTTLIEVARALAPADPTAATKVAEAIPAKFDRDTALTAVVELLAPTTPGEAERLANTISEEHRSDALAAVARAVAAQDRQWALRLVKQIEDMAEALNRAGRAEALAVLAEWLTRRVPDVATELASRALTLLKGIPDAEQRTLAIIGPLARALAPHEPAQCARLADLVTGDPKAGYVLGDIGVALVPFDPAAARRLFLEIPDRQLAISAATDAVQMLAANDLDEAQQFLTFIPLEDRASAVLELVEALACQDALRAEEFASTIAFRTHRVIALARLAKVMAWRDPARARELAVRAQRSAVLVIERSQRRLALTHLAGAWAPHDAVKARRLLGRARQIAERLSDKEGLRSLGLADVARTLAPLDPDSAWEIARSLPDFARELACWEVAEALVVRNPDKTLELLQTIPHPYRRAHAVRTAAQKLVAHNPDKALEFLQTHPEEVGGTDVVAEVVRQLVGRDLDKARRLAETIADSRPGSELLGLIAGWTPGRSELAAMTKAWEDPVVALWTAKGFIEGREHLAPATVGRLAQSVRDAILRP